MADTLEDDHFLRIREVVDRVKLSRSSIYKRISEGTFPAPVDCGGRSVRWRLSAIRAWMDAKPKATYRPPMQPEVRGRI